MQLSLLMSTVYTLICSGSAAPDRSRWAADRLLEQHNDYWSPKGYTFGFKTSLGNTRKEKAIIRENDKGDKFFDVQGEYSYTMPDGSSYTVLYKANDRGYQHQHRQHTTHDRDASTPKWTTPPPGGPGRQNSIEISHNKVNASMQDTQYGNHTSDSVSPQPITDEELQLIFGDKVTDVTSTTESVEYTTLDLGNETDIDGLGNRVGLPSDVIGSLLG